MYLGRNGWTLPHPPFACFKLFLMLDEVKKPIIIAGAGVRIAKAEKAYKQAVANAVENSKNQKKIKLYDASYADFANQFE